MGSNLKVLDKQKRSIFNISLEMTPESPVNYTIQKVMRKRLSVWG